MTAATLTGMAGYASVRRGLISRIMSRAIGLVLLACSSVASAEEVRATIPAPAPVSRHLFYVELLGKGGAYGLGYELAVTSRLAIGAAVSFAVVRDQQIATAAPYVHARLLRFGKHALFGELGATLVESRIPSPVPDWDGMSEAGAGGFASIGWERASRRIVVRASGSLVVGEGGAAPWLGLAFGVRP
ncbi:MAG: hypothetical protein WKG01_08255 [Kofleriaceae bacterium]